MTPPATTLVTPSSLFLHRHIQTRLDLLKPSCESHVFTMQGQQKTGHDQHARSRVWLFGQSVMARNFRPGPYWVSGMIIEKLGPLSYLVETFVQQVWRRLFEKLKIQSELNEKNSMNSDSLIEPDCSTTSADRDLQHEPFYQ